MYDYEKKEIDNEKPYFISNKISELLDESGWKTQTNESEAEILIIAMPK